VSLRFLPFVMILIDFNVRIAPCLCGGCIDAEEETARPVSLEIRPQQQAPPIQWVPVISGNLTRN
jgi:hypothetical protein